MTEVKLYKPTEAVLDNIQRGIALKSKYKRNSLSNQQLDVVMQKAKELGKEFTLDQVKNVYIQLSKLEKVDLRKRLHDGGPTDDAIKYYALGGSAGLAWSRMVLKQADILASHTKEITQAEINKQEDSIEGKIPVVKALNEDLMQGLYVVLEPDAIDAHGDTYNATEVRKACENFNKAVVKANLFHMIDTTAFDIVESYISPVDMIFGEQVIKAGTWLAKLQFNDDDLWQAVLDGKFSGVSIGAMASVEYLEEGDADGNES